MYNDSIDKLLAIQQMSKTALLQLNSKTNKWEASYGGQVFLKSASKDYVVDKIINGISNKAKQLGVSAVEEIGAVQNAFVAPAKPSDPELVFGINERFQILADFVDMVATRTIPSAIVIGEGGLGKSHTVFKALKSAGLFSLDQLDIGDRFDEGLSRKAYCVVKGFSTAKGLYRTLYENRSKIVVFDDCDSVLKDPVAANLLKAALDSYDKRIISWNAESFGSDEDLPRSFEFTGGVIFISNMPMYKIPQALISRSMPADVSMTRGEIIERMRAIVKEGEFLNEYSMSDKSEALEFIAENANRPEVKSINLRTLINVCKARVAKPDHWKRLALYAMINA
jgi:hypothetical protein